jgi:hypothetical protein
MKSVNPEEHIKIDNGTIEFSVWDDTGLGTWISFLSYALENFQNVHIIENCNMPLKNLKILIDTFNLHDRVSVSTIHKRLKYPIRVYDTIKICSRYIKFKTLNVKGTSIKIDDLSLSHLKPIIGIAMYGKKEHAFDQSEINKVSAGFPWSRYYSMDEWSPVIKKIRMDFGYDILTLDNIEEFSTRVMAMASMCDAIVCYEGGMAHLAHSLGIPAFILPWRKSADPTVCKPHQFESIYSYLIHLDKKSYFLKSIDELTEWTPTEFQLKIDQLRNKEKGNNPLLDGNYDINVCLNLDEGYVRLSHKQDSIEFGLDPVQQYLFDKMKHPLLGGVRPLQIIKK